MSKFLDLDGLRYFFTKIRTQFDGRYYKQEQVDTMLAGKSDTSHNHDGRYYTESEMDTFLNGKSDTSHNHDSRYYTESEIDSKLSGKANSSHTHDDRYYTESEMDTKLNAKANTSHTHTKSQITDFAHTHTKSQITDFAHTHDDRYYTESEMDTKLSAKAGTATATQSSSGLMSSTDKKYLDHTAIKSFSSTRLNMTDVDIYTGNSRIYVFNKRGNNANVMMYLSIDAGREVAGGTGAGVTIIAGLPHAVGVPVFMLATKAGSHVATGFIDGSGNMKVNGTLIAGERYYMNLVYNTNNANDWYDEL